MKLFFDENFGKPMIEKLAAISESDANNPEIIHHSKFFDSGTKDQDWIPKLSKDDFVVITADRGKRCGGAKLPDICRQIGITHIEIGSTLSQKKMFEKIRAVMVVWRRIMKIVPSEGREYMIRYGNDGETIYLIEKNGRSIKTA